MSDGHYPAYWIEMAKRAYTDGCDEALSVIDRALRLNPDRPYDSGYFYPGWFFEYYLQHRFDEDAVPGGLRLPLV